MPYPTTGVGTSPRDCTGIRFKRTSTTCSSGLPIALALWHSAVRRTPPRKKLSSCTGMMARLAYTGSYPRLSRELARWTITGEQDRQQLFGGSHSMPCSITDDHERNHALVAEG